MGHEPIAQPITAPSPSPAAVVPASTAPAPAGSSDWRGGGSICAEHTRLCNSENPHGLAETASPCIFLLVHVDVLGTGPRVVLVHGSVSAGMQAWDAQRALAERFTLVVVARSGYPPNAPLERIDFEAQADELAEHLATGDHLVGHSYGGVVSLLAAARRPDALRSLTVIEPPAFGLAPGDPAVEQFLDAFRGGYPQEPKAYLEFFLPLVGAAFRVPDDLPSALEQGARAAIAERLPSEAEIPLAELRRAPFPKLVVSGAHHPAFDAVCDVLERELGAERAVVPGAGHSVARTGEPFNAVLLDFLLRAA
jgi:pimeloyl-ACP methyl ester carboxylesterase